VRASPRPVRRRRGSRRGRPAALLEISREAPVLRCVRRFRGRELLRGGSGERRACRPSGPDQSRS
jgi:hypothetical protein